MEKIIQFIQEEIQKLHKITLLKEEKKQIEEELKLLNETKDVKAMYRKAGMTPPDGKGIHTKKFHKCVTSVGDEGGKNPYAICMSSLGKEKAVKASHRTDEGATDLIDQRENLEYFLSFNNETVYWKWINGEVDDNGAITIMRDVEGLEYDPKVNYKEKYVGIDEDYDISGEIKHNQRMKYRPDTIKYAQELADVSADINDMVQKQVGFIKDKGIKDSEQITHIIDQAATILKNQR